MAPLMGYIPALATGFALTIFLLEYVLAISIMRVKGKRAPLASGYSNIPFIGHARHLSSESFVAFIWDSWRDAQYGDFEIFVLWKRILCISDFQTAKDILMRRPKTFRRTREFENWGKELGVVGGNGLFNVEGIEWGRIRRLTSSSFATQHVNSMTDLITKNARDLLNTFQKHVDTNRPDVAISASPSFLGYTMATMYALAFGDVLNEIEYLHSNKISEDIKLLFNFFFRRSTIPLPKWMWTQWNDSLEREGQAAMRRLDDSTRTIVSKLLTDSSIRKSLFLETLMAAHTDDVDSRSPHSTGEKGDKSPGNVTIDEANEQSRRPSGQSRRNRNQLSTEELSAQIKTFLLAGTDTSSNLISTLFYHISLPGNAGLQEELYQEVLGVLGECDSIQNLAQVEQLTLLDATLKEANRMNGPVPILTMGVASDTENVTLSSGYVVSPKVNAHAPYILHESNCLGRRSGTHAFAPNLYLLLHYILLA